MLWKCCAHYDSKFGKLSSGYRTGKVSFHSNPKERQCQRMLKLPHNCTRLSRQQSNAQNSPTRLQQYVNCELPDVQAGLEKEMATHSSVLAWRILGMGEPGGLPSLGLHRVGHDWSYLTVAAGCVYTFGFCILILIPFLRCLSIACFSPAENLYFGWIRAEDEEVILKFSEKNNHIRL